MSLIMAVAPSIQSKLVLSFIPSTTNPNSLFNTGGLSNRPTFQLKAFSNGFGTKNICPKAGVKPRKNLLQCYASYGQSGSGAFTPEMKASLEKFITSNKVVLFMKGTKDFPQCGFSNTVVQILNSLNVQFETFNILENDLLRQGLKEYSKWPTFPQLYIDGEFFGGCDITIEAYKSGELQELVEKAMCS